MAPVFTRPRRAPPREGQGNPDRPPGIEGVEMTKVYYSLMRNPVIALPCLVVCALALAGLALGGQTPQASLKTASLESHEGLTVSALPWTDPAQYKEKFPKKSPFAGGVLAVQVSFRNDSDESVRVNLERIRLTVQLADDNRQEVPSLNSEELADAVLKPKGKDPTASRGPKLPIPVGGGSKGGRDKHWAELQTEAQNAAVPSSVVGAHSTVQGLLYFDLQDQFDLLQNAHLYVPQLVQMQSGRALTFFDIDLSRHGPQ
jgi:hypothetical protein